MSYELLENELTKSTLWMFGSKDAKILFVSAARIASLFLRHDQGRRVTIHLLSRWQFLLGPSGERGD